MASSIQRCRSLSDATPLHLPLGLMLKPTAALEIRLQRDGGSSSGDGVEPTAREVTEKIRELVRPDSLIRSRVTEAKTGSMTVEAEAEDRSKLAAALKALKNRRVRLGEGRSRTYTIHVSEAASGFPTRHVWDAFFRDASDMDEMKPGERPDTIWIGNLPVEWFAESKESDVPSEVLLKRTFERFGKIRHIDIPMCDPYRKRMKEHMTGFSKFSYESTRFFEGYIQFVEYSAFARAMDALRGMKLAKKSDDGGGDSVSIRVDFDRTKHLSEASIKRRSIVRERLIGREKAQEEKERQAIVDKKKKEESERREKEKIDREKLSHTREREKRRKEKQLAKLKEKEASEIDGKIRREKKKLLKTQRKLQAIRLTEVLFKRLMDKYKNDSSLKAVKESRSDRSKKELRKLEMALLSVDKEKLPHDKFVSTYKNVQEKEFEEQRLKFQKALEGKDVLRSLLDIGKNKVRGSSISSVSSGSDIPECTEDNVKLEKNSPKIDNSKQEIGNYGAPCAGYYPYNYYNYHQPLGSSYYPNNRFFSPQDAGFSGRGRGYSRRNRGIYGPRGFKGMPRMPYFNGDETAQMYYKYFKNITDGPSRSYDNRDRSRSYSRSRSRSRRSYSRSGSRSYSRSRSHSRSRSRRRSSRHRSKYSRSKSYSRSRSRSRYRSKSRSYRSRSKSNRSRHSRRLRTKSQSSRRSRNKSKSKSQDKSKAKDKSRSRSKSSERKVEGENNTKSNKPTDFIPRQVWENTKTQDEFDKSDAAVNSSKDCNDKSDRSKRWSSPLD